MDNLEIQLNTIHSSTKLYFNQAIKKNSGPPQFYIYIYIYIFILKITAKTTCTIDKRKNKSLNRA